MGDPRADLDPSPPHQRRTLVRRDPGANAPRASSPRRGLGLLLCALVLGIPPAVAALSDPLTLAEALGRAPTHPRVKASTDLTGRLPPRQSLYLSCQQLALPIASTADPDRNRPLDLLISRADAQRIEIMARFFDVLLADLSFASESEAMAVAYIQFDRAAVRGELGQISPLRVLELETVYQEILHRRATSELGQQLTRALLAQALGDPEDLPRNLLPPELPPLPETLPTLEEGLALASATKAVDDLLAERSQADRDLVGLELRQQILELLLRLRALVAAERYLETESAWRDLKLDESRTLYEQEVSADLGYSMSQQTQTRLQLQRVGYCRALAWAELRALMGRPLVGDGDQTP